ncbi:MAG TPA: hypothetical protein VIS26_06835, partial [Candidatus Limnocylindria bacterium]
MTYTTQTFEQPRGAFHWRRVLTGAFIVTLVSIGAVMFTPISNSARALTFHSSIVGRPSPTTIAPGATAAVTLSFKNTGLTAWEVGSANAQAVLAVKGDSIEFARAGMAVGWLSESRIATTTESTVAPGDVGTFTFALRAPATLGVYRIPVRLVIDGVTWMEDDDVFVVIASDFGFHTELVDQSRHPTLRAGETSAPITVKLRNTGTRAWVRGTAGEQVNLGLAGDDRTLAALGVGWPSADRVAIQTEPRVAPGDVGTFAFRVRAQTPGTYALRLRPVVDGVTWLEDGGVMSLITVTSVSGQPAPQTAQTAGVTFASSASVATSLVSAGEAASITAAFTSSAATTALVGVEIYTPEGTTLAFQKWFEGQSFTPGEPRSFPITWQLPITAAVGDYTVSLRAFAPGWKSQLGAKDGAATFSVAEPIAAAPTATAVPAATSTTSSVLAGGSGGEVTADRAAADVTARNNGKRPTPTPTVAPTPRPIPSFTTSATVVPTTIDRSGSVSISASFTSVSAVTVNLIISIYAPGASLAAYQESSVGQSFGAGQQRTYTVTWLVPSDATTGTYRVGLGVYSSDWVTEYKWTDSAATFAVAAPAPSPTPSPVPTATPASTP